MAVVAWLGYDPPEGMGTATMRADLHTRARVWAGTSSRDWIRHVPNLRLFGFGHGADPTSPAFGARRIPTDSVPNHDSYLVPGSAALAALANIALTGHL